MSTCCCDLDPSTLCDYHQRAPPIVISNSCEDACRYDTFTALIITRAVVLDVHSSVVIDLEPRGHLNAYFLYFLDTLPMLLASPITRRIHAR